MKASTLIKRLIAEQLKELHVALPAKIEDYDPQTLRARVTLLNKKELAEEEVVIPPLIECPVRVLKAGPFLIRPPYEQGDVVQVLFNERALDKLLINGEPASVEYSRCHSFDDAVIIGGLKVENSSDYQDDDGENLYIANVEKEARIVIDREGQIILDNKDNQLQLKPGGGIKITAKSKDIDIDIQAGNATIKATDVDLQATGQVKLGQGASHPVALGDVLQTWLNSHMHTGNMGAPTSPPISPANVLSQKVTTS